MAISKIMRTPSADKPAIFSSEIIIKEFVTGELYKLNELQITTKFLQCLIEAFTF
jgi:hypothetical protein